MSRPSFVYVTYIRTTAKTLWQALTDREYTRQYWFGTYQLSDWKKGSSWKISLADGRISNVGEILETDPQRRIVIKWRHEIPSELKAEGWTRCAVEIEPRGAVIKLSITHEAEKEDAHKIITALAEGWPLVLAGLKSLLEWGKALQFTDLKEPEGKNDDKAELRLCDLYQDHR
jgi:uncharacterized protein YndB with AHSA1/START domain